MADHGAPKYATAAGNDYEQHEQTYKSFVSLTKWVMLALVIILVCMFTFLT